VCFTKRNINLALLVEQKIPDLPDELCAAPSENKHMYYWWSRRASTFQIGVAGEKLGKSAGQDSQPTERQREEQE
jgi:hypothetical protein